LGLLKLIHAQRLLPLEELLSGAAGGSGMRGPAQSSTPRATTASARPAPTAAPPSISPFASSNTGWNASAPSTSPRAAVPETPSPKTGPRPEAAFRTESASRATSSGSAVATVEPVSMKPAEASAVSSSPAVGGFSAAATLVEDAPVRVPEPSRQPGIAPGIEAVRHAIGSALVDGGHVSAAELLGAATWTLDGSSLRIEVPGIGKKMLALTINAAAEKIIRQELQRLGAPTRFMVVPGEGVASTASNIAATPLAGSVQEAALNNPLVQRAKEIFHADVRSVVDLRQK